MKNDTWINRYRIVEKFSIHNFHDVVRTRCHYIEKNAQKSVKIYAENPFTYCNHNQQITVVMGKKDPLLGKRSFIYIHKWYANTMNFAIINLPMTHSFNNSINRIYMWKTRTGKKREKNLNISNYLENLFKSINFCVSFNVFM